jgi:CheY-like chemotaxis protein
MHDLTLGFILKKTAYRMVTMERKSPDILVADDDDDDRLLFREAVEQCRQEVMLTFTSDGDELLEHLDARAGDELPDLILIDMYMPKRNGFEVLKALKNDSAFRRIPVIVFTGSGSDEETTRCYELGANTVIRKPSSFNQLIEVVKIICDYWFNIARC